MRAFVILDLLCVLCAAIVIIIERSWLSVALSTLLILWAAYNFETRWARSIPAGPDDSLQRPPPGDPKPASQDLYKAPARK